MAVVKKIAKDYMGMIRTVQKD